jgi:hypothetical protein
MFRNDVLNVQSFHGHSVLLYGCCMLTERVHFISGVELRRMASVGSSHVVLVSFDPYQELHHVGMHGDSQGLKPSTWRCLQFDFTSQLCVRVTHVCMTYKATALTVTLLSSCYAFAMQPTD